MFPIRLSSIKIETDNGISTITFLDLPSNNSFNVYCTTSSGLQLIRELPNIFMTQARSVVEYDKWMSEYRSQLSKYLYDDELAAKFVKKIQELVNSVVKIEQVST